MGFDDKQNKGFSFFGNKKGRDLPTETNETEDYTEPVPTEEYRNRDDFENKVIEEEKKRQEARGISNPVPTFKPRQPYQTDSRYCSCADRRQKIIRIVPLFYEGIIDKDAGKTYWDASEPKTDENQIEIICAQCRKPLAK